MKRIAKAGMAVGILFGSALVAYAITSLLFTQSQTSFWWMWLIVVVVVRLYELSHQLFVVD